MHLEYKRLHSQNIPEQIKILQTHSNKNSMAQNRHIDKENRVEVANTYLFNVTT